jgi:site-specific recombinase XerC
VPFKKTAQTVIEYLEKVEMDALLNQPDRRTPLGARDHALLLFMYNSGARAEEIAKLTIASLQLGEPSSVRLGASQLADIQRELPGRCTGVKLVVPAENHAMRTNPASLALAGASNSYLLRKRDNHRNSSALAGRRANRRSAAEQSYPL